MAFAPYAGNVAKISVDLSGPAQTMLTTLYCKALDADFDHPVLGDSFARDVVAQIDYDWRNLKVAAGWTPLVTVRSAQYDAWASQFLARYPVAAVVHLGCGLDSRVFRLCPGAGVEWYDVDVADVIALRQRVFPAREHTHLVAASATDRSWIDRIAGDRPVLLLAEGISMYLTQRDGVTMLQHVVDRFRSGEVQIDFYNWLGIRSQKAHRLQRQSGSTLHWSVNSPHDIITRVAGVRLLCAVTFFEATTFARAGARMRFAGRVARAIPPLHHMLQYHRYAFGPVM